MSGDFPWDLVDAARLNLGDDYDVYVLCAALSCYRTDIYTAVSMVGDKIGDIRRYLDRTLGPRTGIELSGAALLLDPLVDSSRYCADRATRDPARVQATTLPERRVDVRLRRF